MTEEELDSLAIRWHADAHAPQSLKRHPGAAPRRIIRWVPAVALVASGLVAVGVISLSSKPLPAFAQIEKNLKAVQTAQWEETSEDYDENGRRVSQWVQQVSVRRNPAALLRVNTTPEKKGGSVQILITPGSTRLFEPWTNKVRIILHDSVKSRTTQSYIDREMEDSIIAPGKRAVPSKTPWKTQMVAGELLFERTRTGGNLQMRLQERVWANPKTLQVLRSEVIQDNLQPPRIRIIRRCQNIRYNPVLPEKYFQITTNPSTTVVYQREEKQRPATLAEADKKEILELLKRTLDAWNHGNADGFCKNWDFAFRNRNNMPASPPATERERIWRIRTKNQFTWAAALEPLEWKQAHWSTAVGGSVIPGTQVEVLQIDAGCARFTLSQQTGVWRVIDFGNYALRKRS